MRKQRTLSKSVSFEGVGLHTGNNASIVVKPADTGLGIQFKRTDLAEPVLIKVDVNLVSSTNRGTFLESSGVAVHTVEHLLAALAGLGISNALIEIDGLEIPILDGSAKHFTQAILQAGVVDQEDDQEELIISKPIHFTDPSSGASYIALPADELELTVLIDFDSKVLPKQYAEWKASDDFEKEIASNRTFVFAHELFQLLDQDLIKGGDISNAIVFVDDPLSEEQIRSLGKRMNKESLSVTDQGRLANLELHFDNEPARHKLLDLLGDLSLLRVPIRGKIIATKPGHTGNVAFAKLLKKELVQQRKLKGVPVYNSEVETLYDLEKIKSMLPHRYPFLLVDKVVELSDTHVVGIKNITFNENYFMGHFPGNPVMPGVLQMEALAQTGGILALSTVEEPDKYDTYFLKMDKVKFKKKVVPGDTIILKMELLAPIRRGIVQMQGTVYVGNTIVSEGELVAQIVKAR